MIRVLARSYTLTTEAGSWLGQIILTNDGMFSSVTDWGNLSYAWRSFGEGKDFREFLCGMDVYYFSTKLITGMSYLISSKKLDASIQRYAEKILPTLQKMLKEELEKGVTWEINPQSIFQSMPQTTFNEIAEVVEKEIKDDSSMYNYHIFNHLLDTRFDEAYNKYIGIQNEKKI